MSKWVIQYLDLAGSVTGSRGKPPVGSYVMSYDPDRYGGRGDVKFTQIVEHAKVFNNAGDAYDYWMQQSRIKPTRRDGKPNRPLTAFTVNIIEIGDQLDGR